MRFARTRLSARQKFGALAAVGAALAAVVTVFGSLAGGNGADSFAVDLNTAGNTATGLGAHDECRQVNAGDTVQVDVTAKNIPGGVNAMQAVTFKLTYAPAVISIVGKATNGLLSTAAGYTELDLSEPVPDTNGEYQADVADLGAAGVSGSGYLMRLSVAIAPGAASGAYALTLFEAQHGDLNNDYWDAPTIDARLAVGVTCESLPTPSTTPRSLKQGDVDCNGGVNSVDSLKILRHVASLSVAQTEPCDDIGTGSPLQGDVDCSGGVNSVDSLKILRFVAVLSVAQNEPCTDIGT
jgi:hypothetical protein